MKRINFEEINGAALRVFRSLIEYWLPGGYVRGREYIVLNPTRDDRSPGSFSINLDTGKWADFATGDRGGDPISLWAYLYGMKPLDAAVTLADILGVPCDVE